MGLISRVSSRTYRLHHNKNAVIMTINHFGIFTKAFSPASLTEEPSSMDEDIEYAPKSMDSPFTYECNACSSQFYYKHDLADHALQEHGILPGMIDMPKCNFCGKRFLQNSDLESHEQIHSRPENLVSMDHFVDSM